MRFPTTVGSYWVYSDTTIEAPIWQVVASGRDSIAIIGTFTDQFGEWIVLNQSFLWMTDTILISGDTIFSREHTLDSTGTPIDTFKTMQYVSPADSLMTYPTFHDGFPGTQRSAELLDTTVYWGTQMYSGCFKYYEDIFGFYLYTDILAPGIGFVCARYDNYSSHSELFRFRERRLVKYHVAQPRLPYRDR